LRVAVILALGLGVAGSAFLVSFKGRPSASVLAFYAFLTLSVDGLGQILAPLGWPVWPLMVFLVVGISIAEPVLVALGIAAQASLLAAAETAAASFQGWKQALVLSFSYTALVFAVNYALKGEKRRLSSALGELARLRHGIDQFGDELPRGDAPGTGGLSASLRQVSEDGRRARQIDRVTELHGSFHPLVRLARAASGAHAVLYFDLDRQREVAYLRAFDGPASVVPDCSVPLTSDPFAFVLDRQQSFYATDFKKLLWSLPFYREEVRIGSLLAIPVRVADAIPGVLVADRLEIQSLTGREPELLEAFASLIASEILRARTSLAREDLGLEFKAVYAVSRGLAVLRDRVKVRGLLLRSARELVPAEAGAVVMADRAQSRYVVEEAHGWAKDFEGREVGLDEKTWAAWVLRSAEDPYLLDDIGSQGERMPLLVLDEGGGRAESLLAVPLRVPGEAMGALMLMGRRGAFDAAAHRVLGILANQASAVLALIRAAEDARDLALRDGLTRLYNRRAFGDMMVQAIAREDRRGGCFGLALLDIDHFKKLNDSHGHPAGDAALANTARVLERHLRKGDQAARYGGEEFAVILPGTNEAGALHLAERVREAIEKAQVVFEGARLKTTVSLGVAVWPADGKDEETLLASADRALYAAKQQGRNRVVAASSLSPSGSAD
jgi:diguanylate cyclase (GGDEF)-like protein